MPHSSARNGQDATRREQFPALPPRLFSGQELGDFRIRKEVARGATAAIYRAFDARRGHDVALKVLSGDLSLVPAATKRFQREAELAIRVRGPGVLPVFEAGSTRQYHYYSMELEPGETAHTLRPAERPLGVERLYRRVALAFAGVARALERVHQSGIVHRDVKPENLLVGWTEEILLGDFGSAVERGGESRSEPLWGTVRYLSPDQFLPRANPEDPRIDVYALGMSLYEVVTGAAAFPRCPTEELVQLKVGRRPPPPRHVDSRMPLGLDAIIRQAIEGEPDDRYSSARALADDLERFATFRRGHRR